MAGWMELWPGGRYEHHFYCFIPAVLPLMISFLLSFCSASSLRGVGGRQVTLIIPLFFLCHFLCPPNSGTPGGGGEFPRPT